MALPAALLRLGPEKVRQTGTTGTLTTTITAAAVTYSNKEGRVQDR